MVKKAGYRGSSMYFCRKCGKGHHSGSEKGLKHLKHKRGPLTKEESIRYWDARRRGII